MPQRAPKNIRKESPNVPDKGQVATVTRVTSRTTEPRHHKGVAVLVIFFISIISLSLVLMGYPSFQSYAEEMVFQDKYMDDDSHDSPPDVNDMADCLFKSAISLCTQDTGDSQTSGSRALISHIFLLFMEKTRRSRSRCADYVGESLSIMPTIALFVNVLARNMATTRFQKA